MAEKPNNDFGKKEIWGCIGTVTAALITGIITLIVADKLPFFSPTPTFTPPFMQAVIVAPFSTATYQLAPSQSAVVTPSPTAPYQPDSSQSPSPILLLAAQKVQWIPDNDGIGTAGLCVNDWRETSSVPICPNKNYFVAWNIVKSELEQQVLPLVSNVPSGSTLKLRDGPHGELNWIIQVIDPTGNEIANVWIGNDPLNSWEYDGLIRIGYPYSPIDVWATFVRYSDNSYRKE